MPYLVKKFEKPTAAIPAFPQTSRKNVELLRLPTKLLSRYQILSWAIHSVTNFHCYYCFWNHLAYYFDLSMTEAGILHAVKKFHFHTEKYDIYLWISWSQHFVSLASISLIRFILIKGFSFGPPYIIPMLRCFVVIAVLKLIHSWYKYYLQTISALLINCFLLTSFRTFVVIVLPLHHESCLLNHSKSTISASSHVYWCHHCRTSSWLVNFWCVFVMCSLAGNT